MSGQATEYGEVVETTSAVQNSDCESERTARGEDADAPMVRFQAVVRILDVTEPDAPSAKRAVEERLLKAGFSRWWLVSLRRQALPTPVRRQLLRPIRQPEPGYAGGGMLLVGALATWGLWILWLLAG